MPSRFVHVLLSAGGAVLLVLLATALLTQGSAKSSLALVPVATPAPAGSAAPGATPSPTSSPTPTETPVAEPPDWIDTTVYVTPSATSVAAGQSITITPELVVTGTCAFPIKDVTLYQDPTLFAYSDPADKVIVDSPLRWRLTALRAGVTTFTVEYFGETYCDNVWNWHYARGQSEPVTVTGGIFGLPMIGKGP